jgi:Fe2+ or Zn2+ uptake regulation protein
MSSHASEDLTPAAPGDSGLRRALAASGWRFTRQREAVFSYLRSADYHPTAEQVHAAVRKKIPSISLATVYKALEALVDAGLAAKLPDASGPARFDCRHEPHYHLRCVKTGEVRDLPTPFDPHLLDKLDPDLIAALHRQGFEVTGHHLELLGYFQPGS